MRNTYDRDTDAVYIQLVDEIGNTYGGVKKTYACDPIAVDGMINLDFDLDGRLLGIEILDASAMLPAEFLQEIEGDATT